MRPEGLIMPGGTSEEPSEDHKRQLPVAMKAAKDIKQVTGYSPSEFEALLYQIETYAPEYNWSDRVKNCILLAKYDVKKLDSIGFKTTWTWEKTLKEVSKASFTYSFEQLTTLLNRFKKSENESFRAALERLLSIMNFRNLGLKKPGSHLFQRYILYNTLRRIIPKEYWYYVKIQWDWEKYPYDFGDLILVMDSIDVELVPREHEPTLDRFTSHTCYSCGGPEHGEGACENKSSVPEKSVNQDVLHDKMDNILNTVQAHHQTDASILAVTEQIISQLKKVADLSRESTEMLKITNKELFRNLAADYKDHTHELNTTISSLQRQLDAQSELCNANTASNGEIAETLRLLKQEMKSVPLNYAEDGERPCKRKRQQPGQCWRCKHTPKPYHWRHRCPITAV